MAIPLLVAAVALGVLAALIQNQPKPAFAALLVAAVVWAPDAVYFPASFWHLQGKIFMHVVMMRHPGLLTEEGSCLQVMASWPATFLKDAGAATGVALINSIGSIGGFMGPYIIGKPTIPCTTSLDQLIEHSSGVLEVAP